jgi:hypothetical protein
MRQRSAADHVASGAASAQRPQSRRTMLRRAGGIAVGAVCGGLVGPTLGVAPAHAASPYPPFIGAALRRVDASWRWRGGCGSDQWPHTAVDGATIVAGWGDGWGWQRPAGEGKSSIGFTKIGGTATDPVQSDIFADQSTAAIRGLRLKPQALLKVGGDVFVYGVSQTDDRDRTLLLEMPLDGRTFSLVSNSVVRRSVEGLQVVGAVQRAAGATGDLVLLLAQHGNLQSAELYVGEPKNPTVWAARVLPTNLGAPATWDWFCGLDGASRPIWSRATVRGRVFTTMTGRRVVPVFEDPRGAGKHVAISWCPSLGGYVLAKTQDWLGLGLFFGGTAFGPWQTLFYGPFAPRGAAPDAQIFTAQIVSMWSRGGTIAVMWSGAPQSTACADPNSGNYDAAHLTRFSV